MEQMVALKTPVSEAEHAIDERTALSLYDCLIPKLKEYRKFRIQVEDKDKLKIDDFKAQLMVRHLDFEIVKRKMPELISENREMKFKLIQQDKEFEIV